MILVSWGVCVQYWSFRIAYGAELVLPCVHPADGHQVLLHRLMAQCHHHDPIVSLPVTQQQRRPLSATRTTPTPNELQAGREDYPRVVIRVVGDESVAAGRK